MKFIAFYFLIFIAIRSYADDTAKVIVSVLDDNYKALPGAKLCVHLWNGRWERTKVTGVSDQQGRAELVGVKAGNFLTVSAEADGWASTSFDMELAAKEDRKLTIRLRRPAFGTVRVQDKQGKPIQGAILSILHFNAGDGGSLFHRPIGNEPFPFEPSASDAQGVIILPAMPTAAKVELSVFHPDYLPQKVGNLQAIHGELASVQLDKGTELRFKFSLGDGLAEIPNDLHVTTNLSAFRRDKDRVPGLYLPMRLSKLEWHCQVVPAMYEEISVRSESNDYTITPSIYADSGSFQSQLNVTDGQPHEINFLLRKNIRIRGKLSGYLEGLGPHATAIGSTENLHPTIELKNTKPDWQPVDFQDIRHDGSFELSLPPGKAKLSFGGLSAAIVEPSEFEFRIEVGKQVTLPELTIRKLDNIRGQLVDENHQPLSGAIARIFVGVWASKYVTCDADGKFSIPPDIIVETARHQSSPIEVSVIGFDLKSGKCSMQTIPNWQTSQDLRMVCESRAPGWLLNAIDTRMRRFPFETPEHRMQELQEAIAAFPQGSPGQVPPDLSEGTWLNTQANSLNDFKGKYVLLDFWFIGCGPCEAELPQVRLLQEMLGGDRFTVVSVHVTDQTVDNVRQYAAQRGLKYPIVVDNENAIMNAISKIGVESFPTYVLLGPDGRILHNDRQSNAPSLRMFKLERILSTVRGEPAIARPASP